MEPSTLIAICSGFGFAAYIIATINSIRIDRLKERIKELEHKNK
jgi:hypothetical protein